MVDGISRRVFMACAAAATLSSCARQPGLKLLGETFAASRVAKSQSYPLPDEEILASPYALLGFRQGSGTSAIFVLSDVQDRRWEWLSLNRVQLVMDANRIAQTTGLFRDVGRTKFVTPDLAALYQPAARSLADDRAMRVISTEPGRQSSSEIESRFFIDRAETLSIAGQRVDTLKILETIDVPAWRWKAQNTWWLSLESGLAWRSVQHLTPDQPPLQLEILKRPT